MAQFYSDANMRHALAYIAPRGRSLYAIVDFEVYGNLHGKCKSACTSTIDLPAIDKTFESA